MDNSSPPILKLLISVALAFLVTACSGGGSSNNNNSSSASGSDSQSTSGSGLVLNITDAPVDDADIAEVWVRFTEVIVHSADGSDDIIHSVEDTTDPSNILPYREIELKSLVGGKTMLLGEIPLDAGDYDSVRLVIDPDNTRIVETSGAEYLVKCPSCTQSGFKLNREFTIESTGWIDFTIDFDLRKSLTLRRPNQPRADFDYIVRPTLRILDTELASSYIHGLVDDQHSELDPDACWVYVYQGGADIITPDDICLDPDTSICPQTDRPLLEAQVQFDADTGNYVYNTGLIYPGLYTAALVCEADDPDVDDDLLFMQETEVPANAVADGAQQDFTLIEIRILTLLKTQDGNADEDASGTVTVGDTLTYRVKLGNEGNVSLTNVTVSDPLIGLSELSCDTTLPATLATDTTLECTATYSVQSEDVSIVNTATASADLTDPVNSSVTVDVENSAPGITSTPITVAIVGELYSYGVEAVDPNAGDILTFSLITAPAGMTIDPSTGLINWTPGTGDIGDNTTQVMVEDQDGLSAKQDFTITVN